MNAVRFVAATAGRRSTARSMSGSATRASSDDERGGHEQPAGDQPDVRRRAPAPRVGLGDAEQDRPERDGQDRGAGPVDPRVRRGRHRRQQPVRGERGGQRDEVDPEQPAGVEDVDDDARQRQPDPAADAEDRADHPEAGGHALARERVAHDAERQREHPAGDALQDPAGDHDADRRPERRDDRPGREDEQDRGEHAALAVDVAELADDRRGDRGRQQERGHEPGHRRGARVQALADLRQRRDHERLRQRERDARQEQHEQHLGGVRGGGRGRDVRRRHGGS